MKYRSEIDGLRALAVVPVILFHAGFDLFSGGFVGVDVFFVISGYLITTILIEDIEKNRFSFAGFYERRARRILPALFFVTLVCIPFAWMWMLPTQVEDFSQSLIAVSLFASNILFWRESDYFAPSAEEKPLLHTWSLAVEEQYYVLFPILLITAWRLGRDKVFWMIVVMSGISLLLSEWGWRNEASANFYLAPTRAWELFAGSIAALVIQRQGVQKNNLLALIGLGAIIFAIFAYDETTPTPSVYALMPVLGVVLLVLYADQETIAAKLLSTKALVGIGLISYSAYLWHQPLLAFARIQSAGELGRLIMTAIVLASLAIAFLSWKFIELPFRRNKKLGRSAVFITSLSGLSIFLLVGLIGDASDGFSDRLAPYQTEILSWKDYPHAAVYREGVCFLREDQTFRDFGAECTEGEADVLVWGDSHAAALASGWRHVEATHQLAASSCPPILRARFHSRPHCKQINDHVEKLIEEKRYTAVVLHANWKNRTTKEINKLANTINRLETLGVKNIYVVGGVPQYSPSLPARLLTERAPIEEIDYIRYSQDEIIRRDELVRGSILHTSAVFLSPIEALCQNGECLATHHFENIRYPLSWDYGHLTEGGAVSLAGHLVNLINGE